MFLIRFLQIYLPFRKCEMTCMVLITIDIYKSEIKHSSFSRIQRYNLWAISICICIYSDTSWVCHSQSPLLPLLVFRIYIVHFNISGNFDKIGILVPKTAFIYDVSRKWAERMTEYCVSLIAVYHLLCDIMPFNSLTPWRFQRKFRSVIFKLILVIDGWGISGEITLRPFDKSTLVQLIAWCCQATSHYLNQYWPRSMSP